jgi:hypothetical protein
VGEECFGSYTLVWLTGRRSDIGYLLELVDGFKRCLPAL